jgi:hypothetical protein
MGTIKSTDVYIMPYIKKDKRRELAENSICPRNVGELNYMWTMTIQMYLEEHGESYQTYNDIIGAMECCKLELYARKIRPYEDLKIKENGDVF